MFKTAVPPLPGASAIIPSAVSSSTGSIISVLSSNEVVSSMLPSKLNVSL